MWGTNATESIWRSPKMGGTPYRPKINQFFIIVLKPMVTWGSHPF